MFFHCVLTLSSWLSRHIDGADDVEMDDLVVMTIY